MSQIIIKEPVHRLNRTVKIDFKKVFTATAKGLIKSKVDIVTGNMPKLADTLATLAVDFTNAGELEVSTEETAWHLLVNALIDALGVTAENYKDLFYSLDISDDDIEQISTQLTDTINQIPITLEADFFDNPKQLPFLQQLQPFMTEWLQKLGLNESQSATFYRYLTGQFATSLQNEWTSKSRFYMTIKDALVSPFATASGAELRVIQYRQHLEQQVCERMFDEVFGLKDVYVPLNAYYIKNIDEDNEQAENLTNTHARQKQEKHVVELDNAISAWLDNYSSNDTLKVISGGPGSGKSSYGKMLAARMATENRPVLFIPLHRIKIQDYLLTALQKFVEQDSYLYNTGLIDTESGTKDLLFIFDGLDELSMQGGKAKQAAEDFVTDLSKLLDNRKDLRWRAIISGRPLSIQPQRSQLKREGQVFHLLPYFTSEEERKNTDNNYQDPHGILQQDLRQVWWDKYLQLKGQTSTGLPEPLAMTSLEPITKEPLLNYLVSLSYLRKEIEFNEHTNLNEIYNDLLISVHERKHDNNRQHIDLALRKFSRVLQEIAVIAWHNSGRTASMKLIVEVCEQLNLATAMEEFAQSAESGVTRLLTAFYFREFEAHADKTFEFTHKSFGEYLTAKRIVSFVKTMTSEIQRADEDIDVVGLTRKDAFKRWIELCAGTLIDNDLASFIRGELALIARTDKGLAEIQTYQDMLLDLITIAVANKSPVMEANTGINDFATLARYKNHAEVALLRMHSLCAEVTKTCSDKPLADGLRWVSGFRAYIHNEYIYCNYLNFKGNTANCDNLSFTHFGGANLSHAEFIYTNMIMAQLINANLNDANLNSANLAHADLTGANLNSANLTDADLKFTDLTDANTQGAIGLQQ